MTQLGKPTTILTDTGNLPDTGPSSTRPRLYRASLPAANPDT